MPSGLTQQQIQGLVVDGFGFYNNGRPVRISFDFSEPERVLLSEVGGRRIISMDWDRLTDHVNADASGSALGDRDALGRFLHAVFVDPERYGAVDIDRSS